MNFRLGAKAAAEFLGTMFLVAAIVGSGIMAERLSGGNNALALLANAIATGAALIALIIAFGPISGAHLNPMVSLLDALCRRIGLYELSTYVLAQLSGGIAGVIIANVMFGLPPVHLSQHARSGVAQCFSEFVATSGLLLVIGICSRQRANLTAFAVGGYITAAYWFSASTSFANPAVTVARSLSDTFAGIRPRDVLPFLSAQFAAGTLTAALLRWFLSGSGLQVGAARSGRPDRLSQKEVDSIGGR